MQANRTAIKLTQGELMRKIDRLRGGARLSVHTAVELAASQAGVDPVELAVSHFRRELNNYNRRASR